MRFYFQMLQICIFALEISKNFRCVGERPATPPAPFPVRTARASGNPWRGPEARAMEHRQLIVS